MGAKRRNDNHTREGARAVAEKENIGAGAMTELSETADGTHHLDVTAKAPWPQNVLVSILGMTPFQANSLVDACPETLGHVSYVPPCFCVSARVPGAVAGVLSGAPDCG